MSYSLLKDAITIFLGIIIEATPFVALGVLFSTLIRLYLSEGRLLKLIPSNRLGSILTGSCFGFFMPVCECGNIPLARRLLLKKVPFHVTLAFLLAAPVFNPIVIFATWAAFRGHPEMVILRVVFSLAIALIISFIFSFHKTPKDLLIPQMSEVQTHDHKKNFIGTFIEEFFEMMSALVIGTTIASFVQMILPRNLVLSIGSGPISSILAMMTLAALVSICSNVDAFFALSYSSTFTTGSLLAFLVFGPVVDIKGLIMMKKIFKTKTLFWIAILYAQLTFLFTLFINLNSHL